MIMHVYRITWWMPEWGAKQTATRKTTQATQRLVDELRSMGRPVAVEKAEIGPFSEVSALFNCGPDSNNEGTWLAAVGPNPVRRR